MKKYFLIIESFLLLVLFFSCSPLSQSSELKQGGANILLSDNINVALGIPIDQDISDDHLIERTQYVISYNKYKNVANWVSWNLDSSWYGDAPRYSGNFITDNSLPDSFYKVKHSDYTNSGYDRGHMVRSEERTRTVEDNKASFLMTNILPQHPDLNRGVWLNLEYHCEYLCKKEKKKLFVIAGGVYHSENRVKNAAAIPDSCFKIIVVLNNNESIESITDSTEVIAVIMPNFAGVRNEKWHNYLTTIRRIETSTGYNFLSNLSEELQNSIENRSFNPSQ